MSSSQSRNALEAAVGAGLDSLTTIRLLFLPPALLGLIMLFDSWDSIAIAYLMPALGADWHLSLVAKGSLISSGYAGQLVGALALGAMAERFGRIRIFNGAVFLMSLLAIACAVAPNYSALFGLRFLEGITIGGALPVAITYINELAPTRIRGRYFGAFQFFALSGYAVASLASTYIIPHLGWRWMFGLGALPILLLPLVALTLPESPRWLARGGRRDDASRAMVKLGGVPLSGDLEAGTIERQHSIPVGTFFRAPYLGRTVVVMLLWFLVSYNSFGLVNWLPSIYTGVFHFPVAQALRYSAIGSVAILFVYPTVALFVDQTGRRPMGIATSAIAALFLFTLAAWRPDSTNLMIAMIVIGQFNSAFGSVIVWPYTAEVYPTSVRATAMGVASSMGRAASMITPLVIGVILGTGAPVGYVFASFGLCSLIGAILWLTATHETARIRLESV